MLDVQYMKEHKQKRNKSTSVSHILQTRHMFCIESNKNKRMIDCSVPSWTCYI